MKKNKDIQPKVRWLGEAKLKDKPRRMTIFVKLIDAFGFMPDTIVIQKVRGKNNTILFGCIITAEQIKREQEIKNASQKEKTKIK